MMRVDHVSIAVRDIDTALGFFRRYLPIEMRREKRPGYTDDFNWCDFYIGQFKLELIEPTRAESFVRRFIDKRGEGLHHLSLEVQELPPLLRRLETDGLRIVDRHTTSNGDTTAFISPRSAYGVLVQFWEASDLEEPARPRVVPFRLPSGETIRLFVDHVSMAVRSIDATLDFYRRYFQIDNATVKHQGYDGRFFLMSLWLNGYKLELIEEAPDGPQGFVSRFIERRGEGFHHISIDVDRLDPLIEQFEADGIRVVDKVDLGSGWKTAFISPRNAHGVLLQFWQDPTFPD